MTIGISPMKLRAVTHVAPLVSLRRLERYRYSRETVILMTLYVQTTFLEGIHIFLAMYAQYRYSDGLV